MDRPSSREGVDLLWALQLRRENKAILGRLDNTEKQVAGDAAEYRRLLEVERERVEALAQEVKEIKEASVLQKELQAHKDREIARDARDAFFATGAMGEHEKMMAERSIKSRAERPQAGVFPPIFINRFQEVETQIIAPVPYKSPFAPPKRPHVNRAQGQISLDPPSTAELGAMIGQESPRGSEDCYDDDDDDDDDLDAFMGGIEADMPKGARQGRNNLGTASKLNQGQAAGARNGACVGPGKRTGVAEVISKVTLQGQRSLGTVSKGNEGQITRARDGAGIEKRTEPAGPCHDEPSLMITLKANPRETRQMSHSTLNKKRPYERLSSVSLRVTEHMAEQQLKKANQERPAKRNWVTTPEHTHRHHPQTSSSAVPEEAIEPPPRPHKPNSKPVPKPTSEPVLKSILKPVSKPDPKPVSKLPRLVQGNTPMVKYYKESNEAFSIFENKTQQGQHEFVNHFLAGIHLKKHKDAAIAELQQMEESTFKNGKPWIMCDWAAVLRSLVYAKLVRKKDVA